MPYFPSAEVGPSLPYKVTEFAVAPGQFDPGEGVSTTLVEAYYDFSLKSGREGTDRNPRIKGERFVTPFRLKLMKWYEEKPQITSYINERHARRAFHLAKVDWRTRRPIRDPNDVPPGWKLVEKSDGSWLRVMDGVDPVNKLAIFRSKPVKVKRLRPVVDRRKSPHIALDAFVNELVYWNQTGDFYGYLECGISSEQGKWARNPPFIGGGYELGRFTIEGWAPQSVFEDYGFSSTIWHYDYPPAVNPLDLMTIYSSEIEDLGHIALNRHFQKIKNQKIDLATELSQAMQTVNMIGEIAKKVAISLIKMKNLDLVGAFLNMFPSSRKELANNYLVYQYGIKPLLGDIVGAAEHLAEYILKARPVKSNGHATKTFVDQTPYYYDGTGVRQKTVTVKIRVKYGSTFHIGNEMQRQAAQLGFTNPANTVWELVPFSFVADWFLPIGDWLNNMSAYDGLDLKESYRTVFIEHTERIEEAFGSPALPEPKIGSYFGEYPAYSFAGTPHRPEQGYLFALTGTRTRELRTVFVKRELIPIPDIPLPRLKSPVSIVHLTEALALLSQLKK